MTNKITDFLGNAFDAKTGEFNKNQFQQKTIAEKEKINIVLLGATGVGKSSLINAFFGSEIVKTGVGKPVTQHLEKIVVPSIGLTLWDTKGIEAKDYQSTKQQLKQDIENGLQQAINNNDDSFPHVAWLCVKESSSRIEGRELDLLQIAQDFNIPVVVVFTDTQFESGDEFVKQAKEELSQFDSIIKGRYARVNSVRYSFRGHTIEPCGLQELLELTTQAVGEGLDNETQKKSDRQQALKKAQLVDIEKKFQAMTSSARKTVHLASLAAGTAGALPIPGSDAVAISAIQSGLILKLNSDFQVDYDDSITTSLITSILGMTAVAQVGRSVVANSLKFIPIAGSVVGGAVSATTATAITEAIGHAYIKVLQYYFNKETGKTEFPSNVKTILGTFEKVYTVKKS